MRKRSKKFYFFTGTLGVLAALVLLIMFRTGPVSGPLQSAPGVPLASAADMPGVNCRDQTIAVELGEGAWFDHDVVGTLCWTGELDGKTLAVMVSGAGYDSLYWDFPYQPDTYSFTRAALRRGLATFNFDRLGMGRSDRPFGLSLGVDNQAHVLAQIIKTLTGAHRFGAVVTIGHSFGSTIALAHALGHPRDVDGIVFTGFVHNSNPGFNLAMRDGVDLAAFKGPFAGALLDPTYMISKPDTRGGTFYTAANTDPTVVRIDELNRQTTSIGEVISMSKYFKDQSKALAVPAFTLIGEDDFVVCGGAVKCTDHAAIIAWEARFFPPAACHEITVLEDTNHNANLHLNAPGNFQLMLDWIERRVGNAGPPAQPCG
ncbi:MAG: alpha/beta hydrolase [Gammaproteobacteria bacterium]|nr:alpha/beta hydrolase [Gammaproteobacteria bacterium]